ncbi:thiolase family protein [Trujillonella endophytica]|uniref:Probable acetyl-CoA acetyltransferase n=1 Tax=Trujillonella endophytica TaxID=673521 RepID=A0A1H8W7Q1_9ACTN|nr:thiolase family protein [Trujillella endophytica]SEP23696.1 acetyl-CoA C-acetyltransferase [Trujillella endophytica]
MPEAVIVSAVRTAIGTTRKGTLADTTAEELSTAVLAASVERSGLDPQLLDDVIWAESLYGGGAVGRFALAGMGLEHVPGVAVNRHCAGSLTTVGMAAASIRAGMDRAIIAGGVQSGSLSPITHRRVPGTVDEIVSWFPPTHPDSADAPNRDMSITVGWNTAQEAGLTRSDMDAWALRSHQRAVEAIDAGLFVDEIVPVKALQKDGSYLDFSVDEHPRRDTSMEKLAGLKVLHPEIEGFSITAGNASGSNDAAAGLTLVSDELAASEGLTRLATVKAWASTATDPRRTGMAPLDGIPKVLERAGLSVADIAVWEINEAFASVPVAACKLLGIDEDKVNIHGSGCSLGHPISASGARMLTTLVNDLRRLGGGYGVATMCAGGGMSGAVLIHV